MILYMKVCFRHQLVKYIGLLSKIYSQILIHFWSSYEGAGPQHYRKVHIP